MNPFLYDFCPRSGKASPPAGEALRRLMRAVVSCIGERTFRLPYLLSSLSASNAGIVALLQMRKSLLPGSAIGSKQWPNASYAVLKRKSIPKSLLLTVLFCGPSPHSYAAFSALLNLYL